jgi:hypothetical protein
LIGFARGRGLAGVVDPSDDERYANERDIARSTRAVTSEIGQQKAASDLENESVSREHQREVTKKMGEPPVYAPQIRDTPDGPISITGTTGSPIYAPDGVTRIKGKPTKTDAPTVTIAGKDGRQEKWTVGPDGKQLKQVAIENEHGEWITPGASAMARATGENRDYIATQNTIRQQTHKQERTEDKTTAAANRAEDKGTQASDKAAAKREKAGKLVGTLDGARNRMIAADAKVQELQKQAEAETDPEKKADLEKSLGGWQFEFSKAKTEATGAQSELKAGHSDLYEAEIGEKGFPYYKIRPFSVTQFKANAKGKVDQARIDKAVKDAQERGQPIEK